MSKSTFGTLRKWRVRRVYSEAVEVLAPTKAEAFKASMAISSDYKVVSLLSKTAKVVKPS